MSRVQLALNRRPGGRNHVLLQAVQRQPKRARYATFAIADPSLGWCCWRTLAPAVPTISVWKVGSSNTVHAEIARLTEAGLVTEKEIGTTCCFATQGCVGDRPGWGTLGGLYRAG